MILLSADHDRFHGIDRPGGYEWTYYDGMNDEGSDGFTAIWFRGVPMSPNYAAAIDRIAPSRPDVAHPRNHSAFAFNLYEQGRQTGSFLVEGQEEEAPGGDRVSFRGNVLERIDGPEGRHRARLAIDGVVPLTGTKIRGAIEFDGAICRVDPHGRVLEGDIAVGPEEHCWVPVVPSGSFSGTIERTPRLGRTRTIDLAGSGYHDRNFGGGTIQREPVEWVWARCHDGERTLVLFVVRPLDRISSSPLLCRRALLFEGGELVRYSERVEMSISTTRHWTGLPRPVELTAHDEDSELELRSTDRHALESGPFYHRSSTRIEYRWGEIEGYGPATLEYLRPDRLGIRYHRPFVRFRVRRPRLAR